MEKLSSQRYRNSQVLIVILFLLFIVGILAWGLIGVLESEIKIIPLQEHNLVAFYLAQAGIEQAKIEVLYGYWSAGTSQGPDTAANNYWSQNLDIAGDSYTYEYRYTIVTPAGSTQRGLTGEGRVLDVNNNVLAQRQIVVTVTGIRDSAPPAGEDDDETGGILPWSWREI